MTIFIVTDLLSSAFPVTVPSTKNCIEVMRGGDSSTVKTDSEGSWSYVFDKELEDGDHQVFAGITDNAGRIVAKSQSFSFVKTAEAFSGAKPSLQNSVVNEPSFIQEDSMLLVGSIAVSALGLVLILLGLHASRRKEDLHPLLST